MFNRVDKCFFISLIIMLINLIIIFVLTVEIPIIHLNDLYKISNYIVNIIVLSYWLSYKSINIIIIFLLPTHYTQKLGTKKESL